VLNTIRLARLFAGNAFKTDWYEVSIILDLIFSVIEADVSITKNTSNGFVFAVQSAQLVNEISHVGMIDQLHTPHELTFPPKEHSTFAGHHDSGADGSHTSPGLTTLFQQKFIGSHVQHVD
jgi:hypothetical protein